LVVPEGICFVGSSWNYLNTKYQIANIKRFDKLTTLSQAVESRKVERVEGQFPMTKIRMIF